MDAAMSRDLHDKPQSPEDQSVCSSPPNIDHCQITFARSPSSRAGAAAPIVQASQQQVTFSTPLQESDDYLIEGYKHRALQTEERTSRIQDLGLLPVDKASPNNRRENEDPTAISFEVSTTEDYPVPRRKSVQFARPNTEEPVAPRKHTHSRHGSWEGPDGIGKSRSALFMSKLKGLRGIPNPQAPKTPNSPTTPDDARTLSAAASPTGLRRETRLTGTLAEENSDANADADIEETADDSNGPNQDVWKERKRRKMRRFTKANMFSGPNQPLESPSTAVPQRRLGRRVSMPDTSDRGHTLSDGEVRDRPRRRPVRRGHSHLDTLSRSPHDDADDVDVESPPARGRHLGHFCRMTVFGGGGVSDGEAISTRCPFFNPEHATTYGAQKWKQVKSTLRLLRQKKEDRFDYLKSAELMAELRAGAPAVLMLASMIQRDEHGNKRIPVLLEQLKLKIKDSSPMPDDVKDRHWSFTIDMQYGSGPSRMSWTVTRTIRDIYNLHFRYRFTLSNENYLPGRLDLGARLKQPKFPYSAFPYLRRARDKGDSSEEEDPASVPVDEAVAEATEPELEAEADEAHTDEGPSRPHGKKSRANLWGMRRLSTGLTDVGEGSNLENGQQSAALDAMTRRKRYVEKQRRTLEKYLLEMIRWLMFRADSNRLCRFLELSALGVRLAAEGSYHGKEGYLHIQSSSGLDFRRVLTPAKVIARHNRKWFLVRQSYVVCVESPENMNIYDVYLVDSSFSLISKRNPLTQIGTKNEQAEIDLTVEPAPEKHHTLLLNTSEHKVRLFSRYQSVMKQFEESINEMLRQTLWHQTQRFDSFAPVRSGVFAQWLVDGRDYMWNVSRAINMAKDVIYIHDWWLSPELYMRRPACISQKWRLDRLLQKKAEEGVKIFVIIYRNVEAAIPIDSEYTKFSLLNLHSNIFVQRSPNQFKKNQFFFAHHEKICIVDHDVAFLGGIDLCFGRWDSPQHPIVDDKPTGLEMIEQPKDAEHCQLFAGKDYSNPRFQDFFRLSEPYEEMYDRSKVPRMPWHDVAMQVVGQPARDLTRHFVQRWNYLRRGRKPTRPLPFLLPPPDTTFQDLDAMGLSGSCEVQILRSATTWSLGVEKTEYSIQNAYVKVIEESEHFVYIENQFFISSTEAYNTKIVNQIGDALVERIIRAHRSDEDWRCVIVIPLMPGFQNTVDEQEGTSVRLILMCQYRSICRGEQSIFGRLRSVGIDPEDYIGFFSLRQWGTMGNGALVTEQLYIHAKTIIVDDRVVIIGSANINERSMLGTRDSECASIVRNTNMIDSVMAGRPYQVGRFAHSLRLRLMREHLGLDIDEIQEEERQAQTDGEPYEQEMVDIYGAEIMSSDDASPSSVLKNRRPMQSTTLHEKGMHQHDENREHQTTPSPSASPPPDSVHPLDASNNEIWRSKETSGAVREPRCTVSGGVNDDLGRDIPSLGKRNSRSARLSNRPAAAGNDRLSALSSGLNDPLPPKPMLNRQTTEELGLPRPALLPPLPVLDDTDIGGPPVHVDPVTGRAVSTDMHSMAADIKTAHITKDCMRDPLDPDFIEDTWNKVARNNTKLYQRIFRCMPDSDVRTWAEYREYTTYGERFRAAMEGKPPNEVSDFKHELDRPHESTAAGVGVSAPGPEVILRSIRKETGKIPKKLSERLSASIVDQEKQDIICPPASEDMTDEKSAPQDRESKDATALNGQDAKYAEKIANSNARVNLRSGSKEAFPTEFQETQPRSHDPEALLPTSEKTQFQDSRESNAPPSGPAGSVKRRRRATTKSSRRGFSIEDMPSRNDAVGLLKMLQGHLVQFPYDWLLTEEQNGNWGYQVDGVAPLAI